MLTHPTVDKLQPPASRTSTSDNRVGWTRTSSCRSPTDAGSASTSTSSSPVLFVALSRGTPRGFDRIVPVTEFLG